MLVQHTEHDGGVVYLLSVQEDDMLVTGNLISSGDEAFDRQQEKEVLDRLRQGDKWAWAEVTIAAHYDHAPEIVGEARLGGCSYDDLEDFLGCGTYEALKWEALYDLQSKVVQAAQAAQVAQAAPCKKSYLVVLHHTMDDHPLRLFRDYDAAYAFAREAPEYPPEELLEALQMVGGTTPVSISIVMFDEGGHAISRECVRRLCD